MPTKAIASSMSLAAGRALIGGRVLVHEPDVVEDGEILDRLLHLEGAPKAPAGTAVVGHGEQILTEGVDRARRRLDEARQDVEEGRLAGAVGADQAAGTAGKDVDMPSIGMTPPKRTVRPSTSIMLPSPSRGSSA